MESSTFAENGNNPPTDNRIFLTQLSNLACLEYCGISNGSQEAEPVIPDTQIELVERETSGQCVQLSMYVVGMLIEKYPSHFPISFVLQGKSEVAKNLAIGHDYQGCFVTQDETGRWYAGFPGNFKADRGIEVVSAPSLDVLVEEIITTQNGVWPDAENIKKILQEKTPLQTKIYHGSRGTIGHVKGLRIFSRQARSVEIDGYDQEPVSSDMTNCYF